MKVLILNGEGTVGKDTFVDILESLGAKVFRYSTIDSIKKAAKESFEWDGNKDEKGRQLLSDLKIASINYNNKPHIDMINAIKESEKNGYDIFVSMIRDIPEIEKAKNDNYLKDKIITAIITSNRVKTHFSNIADSSVYDFVYDYYIENNGTLEELKETAKNFLQDINT